MRYKYLLFSVLAYVSVGAQNPKFTSDQYKKALWMTTRMYGGQRSGDGPNWLIMDHAVSTTDQNTLAQNKGFVATKYQKGKCFTADADGSYSLSGGWVDCGDHVKFGQTMFYAGYMLALAYSEFPAGFDDYYSWDYSDYAASGDYTWEGKAGKPNGIPDILDELKYETDFFIKCARDETTFYSQVGMGDPDHKNWVTSVAMAALPKTEGGQADGARDIRKNPKDCAMPAMCAATLAVMSRAYRIFDPVYADLCLKHANYAYKYAVSQKGLTEAATGGNFYPAKSDWADSYAIMLVEMYRATKIEDFKTEALTYNTKIRNHNWSLCYNNCDDLAAYLLGTFGDATAKALLTTLVKAYKGDANAKYQYQRGPGWGKLRYTANQAFATALLSKLNNETTIDLYSAATIDFIMGDNTPAFSYIVGFGTNCAKRPHHRNYYQSDNLTAVQNTMPFPAKNAQHGYLVGGTLDPSTYQDKTDDYTYTEGGIDYNAGLVGALAYINSIKDPVNTLKFGHPTPKLGTDQSICGVSSLVLDSKITPDTKKTYTWIQDGVTKVNKSLTASTYTVTTAGVYECVLDSAGKWSTAAKVTITGALDAMNLGADVVLCNPASATLTSNVTGSGVSYVWKKGTTTLNVNSPSITVYGVGTYTCTASATGCASVSDAVTVTSTLPTVQYDTICKAGTATLKITSTGSYQWFDVATGGTALASTATYSPTITASKTYYVQDASSLSGTVGPTTRMSTGSDWGINKDNHLIFTLTSDFTINSISVNLGSIYGDKSDATVSIEILDGSGNAFSTPKIFTSDATAVTTSMANSLVTFKFTNLNIQKAWGTTLRMRLSATTINGGFIFNTTGASYPYNLTTGTAVTITGASQGGNATSSAYMYFYNWKVSAGSSCARTPVFAVIDANNSKCSALADTDGDGTPDASDGCPLDKNKIAAGQCGCGVVDTDTDKDGKADCVDTDDDNDGALDFVDCAPLDPAITTKTWYADTDGDGIGDLATSTTSCGQPVMYVSVAGDLCTTDKNKTAPGLCGCGVAEGTCDITQDIQLSAGWNLVSFYVQPSTDSTIATVFASLGTNLQVVKNATSFYRSAQVTAMNSLKTITRGQAYLVNVTTAGKLSVKGKPLTNTKITVNMGWNMIGYPAQTSGAIGTVLLSNWTNFLTIKNFEGFYTKNGTTNSLTNMIPGSGYFIKMSAAGTLTIP